MISRLAPIRRYRPIDLRNPINQSAPLNRGLVAWYLGVPGLSGGSKFYDLRGVNAGTLNSFGTGYGWGPTNRPGGFAQINFNGTASLIVLPNIGPSGAAPRTLRAKVKNTAGSTGTNPILYVGPAAAINFERFAIYCNVNEAGDVYVSFVDSDLYTPIGAIPDDGQFHDLVVTYAGGVISTSSVSVYVDRVSQSLTFAGTYGNTANTVPTYCFIGQDYSSHFWNGAMDDIALISMAWGQQSVDAWSISSKAGYPFELNRVSSMLPLPRSGGANSYTETNTDSLTLSDSDFAIRRTFPSLSDSLTLSASDSGNRATFPSLSDSLTISDLVSAVRATFPSLSDSLTISDLVSAVRATFPSLADSLTLSDLSSGSRRLHESVSDSLTISDLVSAVRATFPSLSDSLTLTATCAGIVGVLHAESLSDSLTMSDMVSAVAIAIQFPLLDQNAVSHNRHRRNWQLLTKYYNSLG
jgi:hypothetical protein